MAAVQPLYMLTAMTGRTSGAERTTVIGTVELKWRTFWIIVIAMVPAGILTACFYAMLQVWAFLWIPIVIGAAFYFIERRTSEGLRLRTYQSMLDKKRSNLNQFYLCGQPIPVAGEGFGTIQQITAPVSDIPGDTPARAGAARIEEFEAFI